ncbi:hypothetical protein [Methanohalophilus mahii]|uniref:Uncharacterized protein n=1 Tax=Methanohalophilus mahii (strain ATCC 35705 / DSM 5219 / SLP) TaxID=547558 RepID=D5EAY6_METMS|nr:hypothetical protein [Methanohalophilus mahii]ADE36337.1 hypothetical protein Mmah_0814 [Methanohalophilus mahii DSM 5219]
MMFGNMMYGTGFSVWGMILNFLLILLVIGFVVSFLNRGGTMCCGSQNTPRNENINAESQNKGDTERLNRLENEVKDTKKMIEEIKDKFDEV